MGQQTPEPAPILAHWKMRQVLQKYPQLLETLVEINPKFAALRNPLVRRVQGQLVTVAQAAGVAGLEPATLVTMLNHAIGVIQTPTPSAVAATPAAPDVPWPDPPTVAVDLDVRPYQERGEEPFSAIMAAIAQVPVGQVLRLRNTFDPVPLYAVLGKRGFVPRATQLGPDDWEILLLHTDQQHTPTAQASPAPAPTTPPTADQSPTPMATVTINVSDLVPPEPMVKILEAVAALPPGGTLLVQHVRRPVHLYPRLDDLGCRYETREPGPGRVELLITKPPVHETL